MEPGQLIFSLLRQSPAVAALAGARIFPLRVEQGQPRPALVYQVVGDLTDTLPDCAGNESPRVQVSIFADTYSELCALGRAVKNTLHGYRSGQLTVDYENGIDQPYEADAACFHRVQDYAMDYPADLSTLPSALGLPAASAAPNAVVYAFTAQTTFTISHGLGRYVVVEIYAASGQLIDGDITYVDANTLTISFSQPLTGTVVLL